MKMYILGSIPHSFDGIDKVASGMGVVWQIKWCFQRHIFCAETTQMQRLYKAGWPLYLKFQNPPRTLNAWRILGQPSSKSLIACMAMSAVMISDLLLSPMSRPELHSLLMIRGLPLWTALPDYNSWSTAGKAAHGLPAVKWNSVWEARRGERRPCPWNPFQR